MTTSLDTLEKEVNLRLFRACNSSNQKAQPFLNAKMAVTLCSTLSCADLDRMLAADLGDEGTDKTHRFSSSNDPNTMLAIDLRLNKKMKALKLAVPYVLTTAQTPTMKTRKTVAAI